MGGEWGANVQPVEMEQSWLTSQPSSSFPSTGTALATHGTPPSAHGRREGSDEKSTCKYL